MNATLFTGEDQRFVETLSRLAQTNPFLEERIALEKQALGSAFVETARFWVPEAGAAELGTSELVRPNLSALSERAELVVRRSRARFGAMKRAPSERELVLYQDLCWYVLLSRFDARLFELSRQTQGKPKVVAWYSEFLEDFNGLLAIDGVRWPVSIEPDLTFALLFQVRRAFHYVFRYLLGSSPVSARLRAEAWNSIFTHDLRRYQQSLFARMHDIVTLITGPTGSGKELVAQALGLSRFVPFDAKRRVFADAFYEQYHALHLAALPVALVESELFGHRRGAFTGAVEDRVGWFEACGPSGTIFLDEVGELPLEIQVKLLRAVHARSFNRLGESSAKAFLGKLVAATHRDLAEEMRAGRFRVDLFHRLSADQLTTPSLSERIRSDAEELPYLVGQLCRRVAGDTCGAEVEAETLEYIERHLGLNYAWPGNIRELEQCVRSVLVRGKYQPPSSGSTDSGLLDAELVQSGLSLEALCSRYAGLVYRQTGSYAEAARRLGVDRRTLKQHVTGGSVE